jgi:hypothetical protein
MNREKPLNRDHFYGNATGVYVVRIITVLDIPCNFKERQEEPLQVPDITSLPTKAFAWGDTSDGSRLLAYALLSAVNRRVAEKHHGYFCDTIVRFLPSEWTLTFADIKRWAKLSFSQVKTIARYAQLGFQLVEWEVKSSEYTKQCKVELKRDRQHIQVLIWRDGTIAKIKADEALLDPSDPLRINRYPYICYSQDSTRVVIERVQVDELRVHLIQNNELTWVSQPYKQFHAALKKANQVTKTQFEVSNATN